MKTIHPGRTAVRIIRVLENAPNEGCREETACRLAKLFETEISAADLVKYLTTE